MQRRTFKFKIIIPTAVAIAALVVIMSIFQSVRFSSMGNSLINEKLDAITNSLQLYLYECEAYTKVAAVSISLDPEAIAAVRDSGRNDLVRFFTFWLDVYQISYFTVADANGKVLARTHDPNFFGDSIISQQNIRDALDGKISTHFEAGSNDSVSVITGAPVYDADGSLLGVISAGIRFDSESEVENLKNLFGSEVTVFSGDMRVATTITLDGHSIVGTRLDPEIAEIVVNNSQEYSGDTEILGVRYKTYFKPIMNAGGEAFATIFLGIPLADLEAETNHSIRDGLFVGLGGLVIFTLLLYFVISTISQPITKLSNDMHHIANGNLNIDAIVKNNDEVGNLGKSLMKVAGTLRKLLDDIDKMITEHKKGNIEYCLDAGEFLGDYKTLADNILELAAFGMKDQLTGLPNRRSFDNRIGLEWERAARSSQHISLLMLDIDKFKNYNDSFGHQQGDVTLQTVANTIKQSLNRSIDFTARWGGEEFVVLLPDTNAVGGRNVAERIRIAVEEAVIPCEDERGRRATVSIGVSSLVPTPDGKLTDFIEAADSALYRAKESGRNKVVVSELAD